MGADDAAAIAAAAAAAQAGALKAACAEMASRLHVTPPLPPYSADEADGSSSAGFSTEGCSDGGASLRAARPRSGLSPRAARHPRRLAAHDGAAGADTPDASPSRGGAASARRSVQLMRRRKRALEKLMQHGSAEEVEAARKQLPEVQAALSRLYAELQRGQLEALISEREEGDAAVASPSAAAAHPLMA